MFIRVHSRLVILLAVLWPAVVMSEPSLLIEELTWPEVRAAIASGKTTAIYLAGSVEENGPHMVLGKHNMLARYEGLAIARELGNALVYPVMPFAPTGDPSKKTDLMEFPGSVSIADKTFGLVARDVALSAIAAGFKNVVLMGEHGGGQEALKEIAASLDTRWSPKGFTSTTWARRKLIVRSRNTARPTVSWSASTPAFPIPRNYCSLILREPGCVATRLRQEATGAKPAWMETRPRHPRS